MTLEILSHIVGFTYTYFWLWLLLAYIIPNWFVKKGWKDFKPSTKLTFQFTTKGGNWEVVARGMREILLSPLYYRHYSILVVTESKTDVRELKKLYPNHLHIKYLIVPKNYQTAKGTQMKARGLQYAIENQEVANNIFIVHYDEESVITRSNITALYYQINKQQKKDILCGQIYYPLEYKDASLWSRIMEANRAFVEPECAIGLITSQPKQGHGSNMVVRSTLEKQIGWDIGLCEGKPLIAEDILFLITAKSLGAKFGWHGVEMIEQPAFTLQASIKQRHRWVFGTLQALSVTKNLPAFLALNFWDKFQMTTAIWLRCLSYGLGFAVSIINLLVLVSWFFVPYSFEFKWLSFAYLIMWLGAYQYGVFMNTRLYGFWYRIREHLIVLVLCPIAGILESWGAILALFDWYILRKKGVDWKPTPKKAK
jgi:hypothetical protein